MICPPITLAEAKHALSTMCRSSAPGPDGFGPSFYMAAWDHVAPQLQALLSDFCSGTADLDRINRAHIVLIPKKPGICTPAAYRPISLQNCPLKIVAKALTLRLQKEIPKLIDLDQTGFIRGRSISENFVLATELVQCCHKRKAPTLVLKLDFAKAFDSVSWDSLKKIMLNRGLPAQWCTWIDSLLLSSRSAVLVNGCPGPWFSCKRGLRQGDPLSPYLFLLVADVLQALLKKQCHVRHPIVHDLPCAILQYADDTLILLRAASADVQCLKTTLDHFSAATGLHINYNKSTLVPMHVPEEDLPGYLATLGCVREGFPQTYLGLPLSHEKLRLSAFVPLISKFDRHLTGWQSRFLNHIGRTALVNSVLDSLPTYAMSAVPLLQGTIDSMDKIRRAFLWSGDDTVSGAQCLVAWEQVSQPKENDGLGVKNIVVQNKCLLLKLIHRLHHPDGSAWAIWVRSEICIATLQGPLEGMHWDALRELLPIYQSITVSEVGDGCCTDFWHDSWLPGGPLADAFAALYSHSCSKHVSGAVQCIMPEGLAGTLAPRLSPLGRAELATVLDLLSSIQLTAEPDRRLSPFATGSSKLKTAALYKLLMHNDSPPAFPKFTWRNKTPPKAQFFVWLLSQDRIHCKANLLKKNIVDEDVCDICTQSTESAQHLIFDCPFAATFGNHIGLPPQAPRSVTAL